jgi:hypothetical protein
MANVGKPGSFKCQRGQTRQEPTAGGKTIGPDALQSNGQDLEHSESQTLLSGAHPSTRRQTIMETLAKDFSQITTCCKEPEYLPVKRG